MKVSELSGAELDYWVAKVEGYNAQLSKTCPVADYAVYEDSISCWIESPIDEDDPSEGNYWELYEPSWMWHTGGLLIEKYEIRISCADNKKWWAERRIGKDGETQFCTSFYRAVVEQGSTPLIAAMRCLVASKYGDEVDPI